DETCSPSQEADVTLIEKENIPPKGNRPDSVPSESIKISTQDDNQFAPQDSIRDDSVPTSINFQKDKRRVGRPRKGEIIVTKKVQFKEPIRVQPTRLVKRK
ncbi:unnamed protein product, partial [Brachionus calyciflorus]